MPPPFDTPHASTDANQLMADAPCTLTRAGIRCDLQGICAQSRQPGRGRIRLARGQLLYAQGDRVDHVFCVQHGCLKSVAVDADGVERVHAFHLPGELVGLDGLGASAYPAEVSAATSALLTALPLEALYTAAAQSSEDSRFLLGRLGRALARAHARAGDHPVDARIAAFLIDLRMRIDPQGTSIDLPMPRRDIAAHLRIAPETVSRSLQRLSGTGLIRVSGRRLRFEDVQALTALGGALCTTASAAA